ncbi:MAG TPA: GTPase ObgE [Kiritimatiellia bacterium]|nr:GTPase ObgE [Kiritimatiellia bacterium]
MTKGIAFRDRVVVHVAAGNGGDGAVSFRREKFIEFGGPDGGNGGNGGSVHLRASHDVDSLVSLYYQPHQRAPHGKKGASANRTGESGTDLILPVPCGTVAWEIPPPPPHQPDPDAEPIPPETWDPVFLGEVVHDGDQLLIAQGGKGGRGNVTFASSTNRAPRQFTPGTEGEKKTLRLELKIVADVGLVGYPNAGKSTLLTAISHAHPKIAPYPFTTLNPIIGTITFDDYSKLRVADIPGLIDGAHHGVGLGHDFLRHIERTRLILYVIDMAGFDGRDPLEDYRNLRRELRLHQEDLDHRPCLILANKMDLPEARDNLPRFIKETGENPMPISADTREGIPNLLTALYDWSRGLRHFDQH